MAPKSWAEKRLTPPEAKLVTLEKPMSGLPKGATLLIPTPRDVEAYFRSVPYGQTRDVKEMRAALAKAKRADGACAMTTGIVTRVAAEAAFEELEDGARLTEVAPFWRVIDPASPLARKLKAGPAFIRKMRKAERSGDHGQGAVKRGARV